MSLLIKSLPIVPMTANQRERSHWRALAREKDDFTSLIPMCPVADRQAQDGPKRRVEIVIRKTRGPIGDSDGRNYRAKSINDALQRRGWIYDDSDDYIVLEVREENRAETAGTYIAVSEISEEAEAA